MATILSELEACNDLMTDAIHAMITSRFQDCATACGGVREHIRNAEALAIVASLKIEEEKKEKDANGNA